MYKPHLPSCLNKGEKMTNIKKFNKDISVTVEFNTDRVALGSGTLVYHPQKAGNTKDTQLDNVIKQLKEHKNQIENAIKQLREE